MKKQSSIKWLVEQYQNTFGESITKIMKEEIDQAKQMHKQEISKAYYDGYNTEHVGYEKTISEYSIDYYKNTYETEN